MLGTIFTVVVIIILTIVICAFLGPAFTFIFMLPGQLLYDDDNQAGTKITMGCGFIGMFLAVVVSYGAAKGIMGIVAGGSQKPNPEVTALVEKYSEPVEDPSDEDLASVQEAWGPYFEAHPDAPEFVFDPAELTAAIKRGEEAGFTNGEPLIRNAEDCVNLFGTTYCKCVTSGTDPLRCGEEYSAEVQRRYGTS